ADVHPGEEDPGLGVDVRPGHGRAGGGGASLRSLDRIREGPCGGQVARLQSMAVALIGAAGRGERLGSVRPKALVPLCGRPMLDWSVAALRAVDAVEQIIVALPAGGPDAAGR